MLSTFEIIILYMAGLYFTLIMVIIARALFLIKEALGELTRPKTFVKIVSTQAEKEELEDSIFAGNNAVFYGGKIDICFRSDKDLKF